MTDLHALCEDLQTLWHRDFPLSKAMGVQVESFADHVITTRTSLTPNTNVHGTAFAGSLYAIEALTAWGLLYLELELAGLQASIIHASGNIDFAKPVQEDIVATASFQGRADTLETLRSQGRVKLSLTTEVRAAGELASRFEGVYIARLDG